MRWRNLFREVILKRAAEYYYTGAVEDVVKESETSYSGFVYGSDDYFVEIFTDKDDNIVRMSCDCPYAEDGHRCKHEAAVLMAIEDGCFSDSSKQSPEKIKLPAEKNEQESIVPKSSSAPELVKPFKLPENDNCYRFFDMEAITKDLLIYSDAYQEAQKLIRDGKMILSTFHLDTMLSIDFEESLMADVTVEGTKGLIGFVNLKLHGERLRHIDCSIRDCSQHSYYGYGYSNKAAKKWNGLCPHKIAALLLAHDYILKNNPGDPTNSIAKNMIRSFRVTHKHYSDGSDIGAEERTVSLYPQLSFEDDTAYLYFKIGVSRAFVLKNIPELVNAVSGSGKLKLGKTEVLDFAIDSFDDKSMELYQFVEKTIRDLNSRSGSINPYRYYDSEYIKDRICLYGKRLDDFYNVASDMCVDLRNSYNSTDIGICEFRDGSYECVIEISPVFSSKGVFAGIKSNAHFPSFIEGASSYYLFNDDTLLRLTDESGEKIRSLKSYATNNKIDFIVGRNYLVDFYRNVLPRLKTVATIKIKDEQAIEDFLPPMPEYEFFLDVQHGIASCRIAVSYGENVINPFDNTYGRITSDFRDSGSEKEVINLVKKYFPNDDISTESYESSSEPDDFFKIISEGVNTLLDIGEVNATDKFRSLQKIRKPVISMGIRAQSGLLDLSVNSDGISHEELLDILSSYKLKKKYHRIKSGEFVVIDNSIKELSSIVDTLDISPKEFVSGKMQLPMYRALYLEKMSESSSEIDLKRDQYFRTLMKNFKTVNDADFEAPESLDSVLRNYQQSGFKWLKTLDHYNFGGILADDMGLGKTLQVISLLLSSKEEKGSLSAMVVCPASLVYNWEAEINRFAPQLSSCTVTGSVLDRSNLISSTSDFDVMISSYDLLKRDISEYSDMEFDYVIIDEAQYIKNHNTSAAKSVKILKAKHKLALTGTPIENRLSELWSIFDFLMPGFLYSYDRFKKYFELPISKGNTEVSERLRRMVSPFILRRLKGDVLKDLPEKLEENQYAKFDLEQQKLYDAQLVKIKKFIESTDSEEFNKSKIAILSEITRIRQICCDPSLVFENYKGASAKREACIDLIKSAIDGGHRILLFSQFTSMLSILEGDLKKEGIDYYKLTGSTSKEERIRLVNSYNEGDTPVFLISLKAGGTGLNLTGADLVIHYDPWWNIAAQNQATDRAHRIGQTKKVSVYKLIAKGSIEEKIMEIQEKKQNLADSILGENVNGLGSMTKEELMDLLC